MMDMHDATAAAAGGVAPIGSGNMLDQGYVDIGYGTGVGGTTMLTDNSYITGNDTYNCAAAAATNIQDNNSTTDGGK